jgi:hypothetical protein
MKRIEKALALLLAFALCFAPLPVSAQTGIEGTWQDNGILGTTLVILGRWGNYMIWKSYDAQIETGTYSLDGVYLVLNKNEDTTTWWRYSLTYHEQTGISFNFSRITLPVPAGLIGVWEGEDDDGYYEVTFEENGEFEQLYVEEFFYYDGNFIANEEGFALCFSDGYKLQLTYQIHSYQTSTEMELNDALTGEFIALLTKAVPASEPIQATMTPHSTLTAEPFATLAPMTPEPTSAATMPSSALTAEPLSTPGMVTAGLLLTIPTAAPETPPPSMDVTMEPLPTVAPEALVTADNHWVRALAGTWKGIDSIGNITMTLTETGEAEAAHEEAEFGAKMYKGTFTADGSKINMRLDDGTQQVFRYMLMGNTLLLTDEQLGNPVTYTRVIP